MSSVSQLRKNGKIIDDELCRPVPENENS